MPTTTTPPPPLKTDVLGRIHATRDYREALLDAFEQSNLPGTKFAAAHGVKYTTFANWRQKRRRERLASGSPAASPTSLIESLVELELPAPPRPRPVVAHGAATAGAPLRLQHASGLCLCIEDARQAKLAAILLRELDHSEPC